MSSPLLPLLIVGGLSPWALFQATSAPAPQPESAQEAAAPQDPGVGDPDPAGERGYLGITMQFEDGWMRIEGLFEGSPARAAGLQVGDRLRLADQPMPSAGALQEHLGRLQAGQSAAFEAERDGWRKALELTLASRSELGQPVAAEDSAPRTPSTPRTIERVRQAREGAEARIAELRQSQAEAETAQPLAGLEEQVTHLQAELQQLRAEVEELRALRAEIGKLLELLEGRR